MSIKPLLRRKTFLLLIVLLPLVASAAPPEETGRDGASTRALERGVELYDAGQSEEALTRLRGFVVRHADSPLLPEAYLYLARIFRDRGQHQEALLYLERIPSERRSPEVRLIEGAALVGSGRADEGLPILQRLEESELTAPDRRLRFEALAEGHAAGEEFLPALLFLHRALSAARSQEREALLQKAHTLLRDRMSDGALEEAAFMFGGTPLGEDARLQGALRAFARGDNDRARQLAQEVLQSSVPFPYRRDAVLLLERLVGTTWLERSVGVVLPLSGRYGTFGSLVRQGMELAQQVHSDASVRLVFVDTDADPSATARAVSELTHQQRVMAIAGPLTGAAAQAAAERAQQERIPLLALSQRQGLPETGDYIFRNSLTARQQVRTLVDHAMEELGHWSFGILAPESRLGQEMAELFVREVEGRGGTVAMMEFYGEKATDFREQILRLQGKDPNAPEEEEPLPALSEADGSSETVPEDLLPFQALFLPDYADRIALIAPQLAFYGLEGVQLLGINGWNSPELLRLAAPHVEGAIFPDGFFRESPDPVVREFVHLYQARYGEEPSILEAQGFDVASILLNVLADPGVASRDDLRRALASLAEYRGVTGRTFFDLDGEAEKDLFLIQVEGGTFQQIH